MTCSDDLSTLVKVVLEEHYAERSDTLRLIARVWYYELRRKHPRGVPEELRQFIKDLAMGKYTNPATIARRKRLIQAEFPELSGGKDDRERFVQSEVKRHRKGLHEDGEHRGTGE